MRLGAPIFDKYESGEEWARIHQKYGYRAAYSPVNDKKGLARKEEFIKAAEKYDIVIAEVGAWCNPMSLDPDERRKNIEYCKNQLFVADEMGARCCVNISGNIGEKWDGHSEKNFTKETHDLIVETTRGIIDAVKPKRTYYTLEMMPWMFPHNQRSYLKLLQDIARERFAVHIDIVNIIKSPVRYYSIESIIKCCFKRLGSHIRSIHVKDIFMSQEMTTHLSEIMPGKGHFSHKCLIEETRRLDENIPLMLEHLATKEEYLEAGDYIKSLF